MAVQDYTRRDEIIKNARHCWDFLALEESLKNADAVFLFGRDDINIAKKGLELYNKGACKELILLGGQGRMSGNLEMAEADYFEKFLIDNGVSRKAIKKDCVSTNTGENIDNGLKLLSMGSSEIILVTHKPHSQRVKLYALKRAPEILFSSIPDECQLDISNELQFKNDIKECVGELDRLLNYPTLGYIEKVEIPNHVLSAYRMLKDNLA